MSDKLTRGTGRCLCRRANAAGSARHARTNSGAQSWASILIRCAVVVLFAVDARSRSRRASLRSTEFPPVGERHARRRSRSGASRLAVVSPPGGDLSCQALLQERRRHRCPGEFAGASAGGTQTARSARHHDRPGRARYFVEVAEPDMHAAMGDQERLRQALDEQWQMSNLSCDLSASAGAAGST